MGEAPYTEMACTCDENEEDDCMKRVYEYRIGGEGVRETSQLKWINCE